MFTLVLWLAAIALVFYIVSNMWDILATLMMLVGYLLLSALAIAASAAVIWLCLGAPH